MTRHKDRQRLYDPTPPPSIQRSNLMKGRAADLLAGGHHDHVMAWLLEETLAQHIMTIEQMQLEPMEPLERMEALDRLSASMSRTMRAISKAAPELPRLAIQKETLEALGDFIRTKHPDRLPFLLEILEPFAAMLLEG